jgi:hypothetical protein
MRAGCQPLAIIAHVLGGLTIAAAMVEPECGVVGYSPWLLALD